jgi:uncharacterized protein (TIGR02444 family)
MSNEFWTFSLASYAAEGVAESCLAVQDQLGIDVNMVLYASWLAATDRRLSEEHLARINSCVGLWREQVVVPLRTVRRHLREVPEASLLRDGVKSLELQAEQHQQGMMWHFFCSAAALPSEKCPLEENLALLAGPANADSQLWADLINRLGRAIGV